VGLLAFWGSRVMLEMLRVIWRDTRSELHAFNWSMLIACFALLVAIAICEFNGGRYYDPYRGWYYILTGCLALFALTGPVCRIARQERDRGVLTVVFWGIIGLLVVTITFVAAFSAFAPTPSATQTLSQGSAAYDRLLNIVPAVIAVWAAGLGWYTHHQIAMKAHRTTHAFNLLMQTRTSSEFLRNVRAFQLLYPTGHPMPTADADYYRANNITRLPEHEAVLLNPGSDEAQKTRARVEIRKIEAIDSAKYLLNYFEFMARGIKSGDLDAQILYDTIGGNVIGVYKRTEAFRRAFQDSQPLAMEFLSPLVEDWAKRKKKDAGNVP
jgi:hypothetical protein